jgi:thioesterase domain-containing protein/acyl carrier protein
VRSNGLVRAQANLSKNGASGSNEQPLKGFARPSLATPYRAPTNPVESLIAEIAAELLDLQQVGVDDSFLELGADSLIALRIMTQLREKYDIAMPQSAMFDGLTVARLAMHVKDKEAFASQLGAVARPVVLSAVPDVVDESVGAMPPEFRELVVPLRETGHLPPLFLIHPAAGVMFPYMELAKQIHPDRPVYAIQARGLDGRRDPDLTCEAMAARYCAFVRFIQPEGPYHIVGYSFGCYVAYEMALLFKNEGRQVGFLGLLDEYAPIDGYRITWADVARMLLSRSSRSLLRHFGDYVSLGWKKRGKTDVLEAGAPLPTNGPLRRVWERSVMAALLPQETHGLLLDQPAMRTMFDLFLLHTQLCFSYAPPAYDGDVTLFTSTWTANRWGQRRPLTPDLGWENLVSGRVDVVPCQGDHLAMIRQPYVMGLAQELERALMRATN